jgi:hypothetical protein
MKIKNIISDLVAMIVIVLIVTAMIAALALVTMWLWNWTMPNIIICKHITFWQALGILCLVSLLTFDKSKIFGWLYE